jgi:hypothetical protein
VENIHKRYDGSIIGEKGMWKKLCAVLLTLCFLVLPVFAEESESETETENEVETDYKALIDQVDPEAEYVFTGEEVIYLFQALEEADELWDDYDKLWEHMEAWKDLAGKAIESLGVQEELNEQLKIENNLLFGGITISVSIVVAGAAIWLCTALD